MMPMMPVEMLQKMLDSAQQEIARLRQENALLRADMVVEAEEMAMAELMEMPDEAGIPRERVWAYSLDLH